MPLEFVHKLYPLTFAIKPNKLFPFPTEDVPKETW